MFAKVLVANRGEIAVRVLRTLRDLGVPSVAVYSEADRDSRHVALADEAVAIGPAPATKSYLRVDAIVEAARATGATAIHPGYGFLAEKADFAEAVEAAGLVFIGPTPENMRLAGSKLGARQTLQAAGVPVVPGSEEPILDVRTAVRIADTIGYPVMLKASAGGGGRGMRVVPDHDTLLEDFALAQGEARAAFGDPTLYIERLIVGARHIEVQVVGDGAGGAVHLGERNCSVQRRHQKLIEEAPSPALPAEAASRLHEAACRAVSAMRYRNAGTVEFLVDEQHAFYFMEINARIQVEHPVTEAITGIDLIRAQLEVAATGRLPFTQSDVAFHGHAIECRLNAEDPDQGFLPQPGRIERLRLPGGRGVRLDTHLFEGYEVPVFYDSLVGKLIAHARTRAEAVAVMRRALAEFEAAPLGTTAPFLRQVMAEPAFVDGNYTLAFLPSLLPPDEEPDDL